MLRSISVSHYMDPPQFSSYGTRLCRHNIRILDISAGHEAMARHLFEKLLFATTTPQFCQPFQGQIGKTLYSPCQVCHIRRSLLGVKGRISSEITSPIFTPQVTSPVRAQPLYMQQQIFSRLPPTHLPVNIGERS